MNGIIGFKKLRVDCIIGILPHERVQEQTLFVDIKVRHDFSACIKDDHIDATIDYVRMAELVTETAVTGKYGLIETYAAAVIERLFETFPISWAWIHIEKPVALPAAACSMVELERTR